MTETQKNEWPSDVLLAKDLRDLGLEELAVRAEASEWNDYFGPHAMPQHMLIGELMAAAARTTDFDLRAKINAMVKATMTGTYDGTKVESDAWAESPEGQAIFAELMGGKQ